MLKSGNEGSGCNDDTKRFVVHADEKLTAFRGLESQLVAKGMLSRKRRVSRS